MMKMDVTIYHNPKCSNSRRALELIREQGHEPRIVEYVKTPLSHAQLKALVSQLHLPVRACLRSKEAAYKELDLGNPAVTDEQLIEAVVAHPILLNRPIVVTPKGARLCRPPEMVNEILS